TDLARKMVCEWGMSELGPLTFGKKEEQIFLGREISQHRDFSEDTAIRIDQETRRLVLEGYDRARKVLTEHSDLLHRMAEALLDRESLDASEIKLVLEGKPLPPLPTGGDGPGGTQEVLRQDPGRAPGLAPSPGAASV
ncbi:MAG: ATP-dependent zinc metalloprotease FtsH, partial [Chloroflexota bacterium]